MADNKQEYGFRWFTGIDGGQSSPKAIERIVASAASFDVTGGASNVALGYGDLVTELSTGGVTMAAGAETTPSTPFGVVHGVMQYFDGSKMVRGRVLPSDTTYGTNLERQSKLEVVPISAGVWELDCDDAVSATTKAAYQALIGENVDVILDLTATNTRPTPRIDISSHATTNTLKFRIVGISPTVANQDFSGNYVKLLIRANVAQVPWSNATGV